jgi:hypothetical protein
MIMQELHLPKKILRVEDLTFILPDDFDGDLQSALRLLANYLDVEFQNGKFNPKEKSEKFPSLFEDDGTNRASMKYGIFEMDENGNYQLK